MKKINSTFIIIILLITVCIAQAQSRWVISSSGEKIDLNAILQPRTIVFLFNSPSCTACKKELGKFLTAYVDTSNYKIIAISRMLYFPSTYWETDSYLRGLCPKIANTYLDFTSTNSLNALNENTDGLFGYYKIKHSPSLLLVNKRKTLLLRYEDIFEGYAVKETIKKMILDFFKN